MPDSYLIVNNVRPDQITDALSELSGFHVRPTQNTKQWFFKVADELLLLHVFCEKLGLCSSTAKAILEEILEMRCFAKQELK